MKRQRGRGRKPGGGNGGGGGGGGGNQGNRSLESNGPEVKIRGTAAQIYEKYSQYARDAQSSGDRVKYETYLQHAEHYFRIMAATMPREQRIAQQNEQAGLNNPDDRDGDDHQPNDSMRVVDAGNNTNSNDDDDDDGDEGEGHDDEDVAASGGNDRGGNDRAGAASEASADSQNADNQGGEGDGQGRGRRRRRRGRGPDGGAPNDGGNANNTPRPAGGGDTEARSALDVLARKQAAVAGS